MKHFLIIPLFFVAVFVLEAQKVYDSIEVSYITKGNLGISFRCGVLYHSFDKKTNKYFDNQFAPDMHISYHYKNFFLSQTVYYLYLNPKKTININDVLYNTDAKFEQFSAYFGLGYSYDINNYWAVDISATFCRPYINLTNWEEYGIRMEPQYFNGAGMGLGINRYFKLKWYNYVFTRISIDYFNYDYKKISPDLGSNVMYYSITLGYKGWSKKIIK
jgi:hypothetical protein